jgi:hypothetical protein
VEDQVREQHPAERDVQVGHVGEVGLRRLAWLVHLRKDDLALGSELRPPRRNLALQRAQLTILIPTGGAIAQQSKQRLAL